MMPSAVFVPLLDSWANQYSCIISLLPCTYYSISCSRLGYVGTFHKNKLIFALTRHLLPSDDFVISPCSLLPPWGGGGGPAR